MSQLPTQDRDAQVTAVLARLENGESERAACKAEGLRRDTFHLHLLKQQAGEQYARGLELMAHEQVNLCERAIGDMRRGTIDPPTARVEIDTRKWFASKFLPKKYGDRQVIAGEPESPLQVVIQRFFTDGE